MLHICYIIINFDWVYWSSSECKWCEVWPSTTSSPATWRPTSGLTPGRSPTSAAGQIAAGGSPGLTSWPGTRQGTSLSSLQKYLCNKSTELLWEPRIFMRFKYCQYPEILFLLILRFKNVMNLDMTWRAPSPEKTHRSQAIQVRHLQQSFLQVWPSDAPCQETSHLPLNVLYCTVLYCTVLYCTVLHVKRHLICHWLSSHSNLQ